MSEIKGIKLIHHNAGGVKIDDDLSFPFKLEMSLRPPTLMVVAFVGIHGGSEDITVRGMTVGALNKFIDMNDFRTHPRLSWLRITKGDEVIEDTRRS